MALMYIMRRLPITGRSRDHYTHRGIQHHLRVSSVHDGVIYGDHDSVPFSEIASVYRRDFSATKTTILVVVLAGVAGAIAAAISSASHPNVGL